MPRVLKKIELNGFKSFAGKTVLELPGGIAAIVGPNGSGKSNIVDAIRWILGEREAKNLRGAKVEDLIFVGTPKRPRVGQAQVGLYFDNQEKILPLDFNEINVLRQTNRSGLTQHFLNEEEVRLKDLIDFFAKARLGTKGLVIIAQGESDVFIKAAPKERREMIEEILGLREYQIKKTEGERKLNNTLINLDKVGALIKEILPHYRSLKRQTSRLEKREEIETELKNLENKFFGSQLKKLKNQSKEFVKKIREQEEKISNLNTEKSKAAQKLQAIELKRPAEQEKLKEIKKQKNRIFEDRISLQKEAGRLEANLEILVQEKAKEVIPDGRMMFEFLKKIREKLSVNLKSDLEKLMGVLKETIEEIDKILASHSGFKNENRVKEIKEKLEEINADFENFNEKLKNLESQETNLEKEREEFHQNFKIAFEEVQEVKEKIEKIQEEKRSLEFENERLLIKIQEIERQIFQIGRHPQEQEFESFDLNEIIDLTSTEKRILRLRGELMNLEEIDENLVKEAKETEKRYEFLSRESKDLEKASQDLKILIKDLNQKIKIKFEESLKKINKEFSHFFRLMFGEGHAALKIQKSPPTTENSIDEETKENLIEEPENEDENEESNEGIEIEVGLPRKRLNSLDALSGGERSLTAIAALFALISVSPPPFLVLDEIDANLDERNARRFAEILKDFSKKTQFIIITHNRKVMEAADILYGVTLGEDGTSKVVSLKFS